MYSKPIRFTTTHKVFVLCSLFFALVCFSSCEKEDILHAPVDVPLASVNYTILSETLPRIYKGNSYSGLGIYVDTTEYYTSFLSSVYVKIPYFEVGNNDVTEAYSPRNWGNDSPLYLDYQTGNHRLSFAYVSDVLQNTTTLAQTEYELEAGKYYCLYIADAPIADGDTAAFSLIWVERPMEKAVQADKVAINLVNLANDAGLLNVKIHQVETDGNITVHELDFPQHLPFGESTTYIPVDISYAQDGFISLGIYDEQNELLSVTGVPASPEHSFELVAHGFLNIQKKKVITSILQNQLRYTEVSIEPNFRVLLQRTY